MTPTAAVVPIDSQWLHTPKTRRHSAKPTPPRERQVRTRLHGPPTSRRDRLRYRGLVRYPGYSHHLYGRNARAIHQHLRTQEAVVIRPKYELVPPVRGQYFFYWL
jgi:hypothetical protein